VRPAVEELDHLGATLDLVTGVHDQGLRQVLQEGVERRGVVLRVNGSGLGLGLEAKRGPLTKIRVTKQTVR
jgi:hypothetical protein